MDQILVNKAQRHIKDSSSKKKGSKRSRVSRKKRSAKTQDAGQSTGPAESVRTEGRSRSRSAVNDEEETRRAGNDSRERTHSCASYTVGTVHGIDMGLGVALLAYGGMVHVPEVTGAAIAYGLLLLLGGIAGALGHYTGACNKKGILVSSVAGGAACILDIIAAILIFMSWDAFIKFLTENSEALMLSDAAVTSINGLKILFAVIFIALAILEAHRSYKMWGMKDQQGTSDGGGRSGSGDSFCDKFLAMLGLQKRKKTDDMIIFDDEASMESSLLWSRNGTQPTSDDYLEFVPEHERGLANFAATVSLPKPDEERLDY